MAFKRGLIVSGEKYKQFLAIQMANKSPYYEHYIGSRKSIILEGKTLCTTISEQNLDVGDLTTQQFGSFIGRFNKQLYKQFSVHPELFTQNIIWKGLSRDKNNDLWEEMEIGEYFYNLDLNSAYWQIAYRLGYVNEKMYLRYLPDDAYKKAKRYCISFLSRRNWITNQDGEQIKCDTDVLRTVYQNIRHELYKVIEKAAEIAPEYLEYNIDGISVRQNDIKAIKAYFQSEGLRFKITECRKVSEKEYYYGRKKRKFKNK